MAETTLNMKLLLRRAEFVDSCVLAEGEPGYHTGTHVLKIGDGTTTWANLPFANQTQIEALIKAVDDKVAALDDTYATDAELKDAKDALQASIDLKADLATYNAYVEAHKDDYTNTQIDEAIKNVDDKFVSYRTSSAQDAIDATFALKTEVQQVATDLSDYETSNNDRVQAIENELDTYGDIVAHNVAEFATAAQGEKADAAAVKADVDAALENITKEGGLIATAKAEAVSAAASDAEAKANQALTDAKAYVDAEDKFEIDMLTINAHGGVAAGVDLNGLTTHEILKKILYPYVDASVGNATASPNGGTYEKGVTKTITSVSISVTKKSEPITSVALYNGSTLIEEKTGDAVKNGGTITFSGLSVEVPTNGNQLTVKVTYPDANGNAKTVEKKTTAMTFVYPYYMGTCAAGTAIDETLVESLNKKIESKGNKSNSFTVSDGHMVFAYPKAHGVLKNIIDPNNFETIGNYTRSEVSITGLDGTAQTYYVYVSGATTVSGFTVNFKY